MKKSIFTFAIILFTVFGSFAQYPQTIQVNGYLRSNGTYVNTYERTAPNKTVIDNYGTYPNVNPNTGVIGTKYKNEIIIEMPRSNYDAPKTYNDYSTNNNTYNANLNLNTNINVVPSNFNRNNTIYSSPAIRMPRIR
jgi:hypothetical protein